MAIYIYIYKTPIFFGGELETSSKNKFIYVLATVRFFVPIASLDYYYLIANPIESTEKFG